MTPLEAAQKRALQGDATGAAQEFEALARAGVTRASAALAEIAAYRGLWSDVLGFVDAAVGALSDVNTLNVQMELVSLAARAARETQGWQELAQIAKRASAGLGGNSAPSLIDALARLSQYAAREGPEPFLAIEPWTHGGSVTFEDALEALERERSKSPHPVGYADDLFGLANAHESLSGAVMLFDRDRILPTIFGNVTFLAKALAKADRGEEAWGVIVERLDYWWPVEETQIAPVELLTDEVLAALMTPERCEYVLSTPRGSVLN
jgi:hypothetical protein